LQGLGERAFPEEVEALEVARRKLLGGGSPAPLGCTRGLLNALLERGSEVSPTGEGGEQRQGPKPGWRSGRALVHL
jgi:hypothetical protein